MSVVALIEFYFKLIICITIPEEPEFIKKQDGQQKQDCENAAVKRWLDKNHQKKYGYPVTLLGDDLYSRQPICELALKQGYNFIFVCLETSHKTLDLLHKSENKR